MSPPPPPRSILIVGAGLAGALLAVYLGRQGHAVRLFERRGDPRRAGYQGGRSINLALSARGLHALDGVGLREEVLRHAVPMRGRMMHPPVARPELVFQPYSKDPNDAINSISRGGLNLALLEAADRLANVEIVFNRRAVDADLGSASVTLRDDETGEIEIASAELVVAADGAYSAVRGAMQRTDRFDYSQSYLEHGYKELHIPDAEGLGIDARRHDGYALEPNALHIWPRGGAMMIALPNPPPDRSFTCTLFWPFDGPHGLATARTAEEVSAHFREHYPDAVPLMPTLVEDFRRNPASSLVTVRCWPWVRASADGRRATALLGDAAHAIVPFYGQGMNAAFEDCRKLAECLGGAGGDLGAALDAYQRSRKPNADAIADMALDNFVEMRDKVGRAEFLYRKRLEHAVHELEPARLIPQYTTVSFSTVPYAEAQRRGRHMERVLGALEAGLPADRGAPLGHDALIARVRELLPAAMRRAEGGS